MDEQVFRSVMRSLAAGVAIVSTSVDGLYYGMTATSFNSVSLEPMLVQISLSRDSRTHDAVEKAGVFGVNLLSEDQEQIARSFSIKRIDRFTDIDVDLGSTGVPLIRGALGTLECSVSEQFPGGDHSIFVGEVIAGSVTEQRPLVYFKGTYHTIDDKEGA